MLEPRITREKQLLEASKRMGELGINREAAMRFIEEGYVPFFFTGVDNVCLAVDPEHYAPIHHIQEEYHLLVYAVISISTTMGVMESYLYVSDDEDEWEEDLADIRAGYAMTYTANLTYPECSEFGSIALRRTPKGGLERHSVYETTIMAISRKDENDE